MPQAPGLDRIAALFEKSPGGDPAATEPRPQSDALPPLADRRQSPRRRVRDRIASLDATDNPSLASQPAVKNQLMLAEDDLRQTALALGALESYLTSSMRLLEKRDLTPAELATHAADDEVLDRLDSLSDSLVNLRRRMGSIAAAMQSR